MSHYLLALLLLVPTQLPPTTNPAETLREKVQREADEKKMEQIRESIKQKDRPIQFYGKILDQLDHPVEGMDVVLHVKHFDPEVKGWFMRLKEIRTKTDPQGRFEISGEKGSDLCVNDLQKQGYAKLSPLPRPDGSEYAYGFEYASEIQPFIPDKEHPVIFHVRKMGATTFLLHDEYLTLEVPIAESGKAIGYDFVQRRKIRHGDKPTDPSVKLVCDFQVKATFNANDATWTVTLSSGTPNGGIIMSEQSLYEAPQTGYQPEYTFTARDKEPEKAVYIYLRSRDPDIYTRLDVKRVVVGKAFCRLRANCVTNPYGDRNLEQTPNLPFEVSKRLTDDAQSALSRNQRPARPDLPKMIQEAKDKAEKAEAEKDKAKQGDVRERQ